MATMIIGYDLNRPGQKYDELFEEIKALDAWWHYLDSTWLVNTTLTSLQVAERLWAHMDANDRLFVSRVRSSTTAWAGMPNDSEEWLKESMED